MEASGRDRGATRLVGVLRAAVVGLLVLGAACDPVPPDPAPDDDLLRWAPPAGWRSYTTVTVGPEGGQLHLDDGTDYHVVAPTTVTGPVDIVGGRDVVWIGGHVRIDDAGPVKHGQRRGVVVRDNGGEVPGRTIHLEGLRLGGNDLAEGVDIDAPTAVVQLANLRVDQVSFRSADDRDGTGDHAALGRNHPDVVQTYGGYRELRIDGLSATSAYQGLFFKVDHDDAPPRPVHLRRVDVRAVTRLGTDGVPYAGNRMFFWDVDTVGDVHVEAGTVWVAHHRDAGKVATHPNPRPGSGSWWHGAYRTGEGLVLEPPPGTAGPLDAAERRHSVTGTNSRTADAGEDASGPYLHWGDGPAGLAGARLLDADGTGPGRLHAGVPPGGSYVPPDAAGLDYVSPGYQATAASTAPS